MDKEKPKLIVFTTLFQSKLGGVKDLLILLGKDKEVEELDREFQKRKIFGPWGLKELNKLFAGFSEKELRKLCFDYCQKNLLPGLPQFISFLKRKKFLVGILSSNPQFMLDVLKENLPLDFAFGTELEIKKGEVTGEIIRELNRFQKTKLLRQIRKKYRIKKNQTIIFGKASITHLPMAREAGIFVGFEPEKENIISLFTLDKNLQKLF